MTTFQTLISALCFLRPSLMSCVYKWAYWINLLLQVIFRGNTRKHAKRKGYRLSILKEVVPVGMWQSIRKWGWAIGIQTQTSSVQWLLQKKLSPPFRSAVRTDQTCQLGRNPASFQSIETVYRRTRLPKESDQRLRYLLCSHVTENYLSPHK